jgi:hypothetical protein
MYVLLAGFSFQSPTNGSTRTVEAPQPIEIATKPSTNFMSRVQQLFAAATSACLEKLISTHRIARGYAGMRLAADASMVRLLGTLFVTAACAGHGSGGVSPDAAPRSIQLGSLSDVCEGNAALTGQRVLAMLQPTYSATFTPNGAGATSAFALAFAYNSGAITCHPAQSSIEVDMPASLDLAVHASAATSDGLFDESFDATVTISAGLPSLLSFDGQVLIADLHGTFTPTISGTWNVHDVDFGGQMEASTTTGAVVEQASNGNFGETREAGGWR